ncbi:hypothetical protein JCM11491_002753 [Sporobolomyces phaffii]
MLIECSEDFSGLDLRLGYDIGSKRFCLDWGSKNAAFTPIPVALGTITVASLLTRERRQVCFYFLRSRRRLWADEDALRKASPYSETMLSSDFAEGAASSSSSPSSPPPEPLPDYTFADSDVESDDDEVKPDDDGSQLKDNFTTGSDSASPCKTIRVVDTPYSTYLAVLLWISSRFIAFAPLSSTFAPDEDPFDPASAARTARATAVVELTKKAKAGLPRPVSPKSVYRLAHLLEMPELAALALANFKAQLTVDGAFHELFSDVSAAYAPVQRVAMDYVLDHWPEVKAARAVQVVENKAERGLATSAMAAIGIRLAKRLADRSPR